MGDYPGLSGGPQVPSRVLIRRQSEIQTEDKDMRPGQGGRAWSDAATSHGVLAATRS